MESTYRPFINQWVYFNKDLNDMIYQLPKIFPIGENLPNRCICISGTHYFITDKIPDLHFVGDAQAFPLKLYEENTSANLLPQGAGDYLIRDGITNYAQNHFSYKNYTPAKEDIFYYTYAILNHPQYQKQYKQTLTKSLPHIPKVKTEQVFKALTQAGRDLAELHINYETVDPYSVNFIVKNGDKSAILDPMGELTDDHYYVKKMKFGTKDKQKDQTVIIYNNNITVTDIPEEAYTYKVNGRSPVEWVMDRQGIRTHKASQITNDTNKYATETIGDAKYPLLLLQKAITVSLETQKIINKLPELEF